LRWALTQAVLVHVRWAEESELSGFYRRLAARKTKQEAVIATAVVPKVLVEGLC
jgi:hypothetical protein